MKNHLLEKLHPNLTGGTPLNIFKIPKNLTQKKLRGFQDLEAKKFKKKGLGYFVRMHDRFGMIPRETKQTFLKFMATTDT